MLTNVEPNQKEHFSSTYIASEDDKKQSISLTLYTHRTRPLITAANLSLSLCSCSFYYHKFFPWANPQRIFLGGPSMKAKEFRRRGLYFKEFQGLAKTTENLQGIPKTSTNFLSNFQLFRRLFRHDKCQKSNLEQFVWNPGNFLGPVVRPKNRFKNPSAFFEIFPKLKNHD